MDIDKLVLSDEELDKIGYPILPLGDRTGYQAISLATAKKVVVELRQYTVDTHYGYEPITDGDILIRKEEWQEIEKVMELKL